MSAIFQCKGRDSIWVSLPPPGSAFCVTRAGGWMRLPLTQPLRFNNYQACLDKIKEDKMIFFSLPPPGSVFCVTRAGWGLDNTITIDRTEEWSDAPTSA